MKISVREAERNDIEKIVDYFLNASPQYLLNMGAEPSRLPSKRVWLDKIRSELEKERKEQKLFYVIWRMDGIPVGHSNINQIDYGNEAYMHLHMWDARNRQKGMGARFVMNSIPFYFSNFNLKQLKCEPYADNPVPINTLLKVGFEFQCVYQTVPSPICLPQNVRSYLLTKCKWETLASELNVQGSESARLKTKKELK